MTWYVFFRRRWLTRVLNMHIQKSGGLPLLYGQSSLKNGLHSWKLRWCWCKASVKFEGQCIVWWEIPKRKESEGDCCGTHKRDGICSYHCWMRVPKGGPGCDAKKCSLSFGALRKLYAGMGLGTKDVSSHFLRMVVLSGVLLDLWLTRITRSCWVGGILFELKDGDSYEDRYLPNRTITLASFLRKTTVICVRRLDHVWSLEIMRGSQGGILSIGLYHKSMQNMRSCNASVCGY